MRFLTLELDGRTTLDRAQQRLYGVVFGQPASGKPRADALNGLRSASADRGSRRMRLVPRWLQLTWMGLRPVQLPR